MRVYSAVKLPNSPMPFGIEYDDDDGDGPKLVSGVAGDEHQVAIVVQILNDAWKDGWNGGSKAGVELEAKRGL